MMDKIIIRSATADDIKAFHGRAYPLTLRAWAVEYEGETVCLAGAVNTGHGSVVAFSSMKEIAVPKITVWRTALKLFEKIKSLGLPVIADTRHNPEYINNSPAFLERLGFYEIKEGVFRYDV